MGKTEGARENSNWQSLGREREKEKPRGEKETRRVGSGGRRGRQNDGRWVQNVMLADIQLRQLNKIIDLSVF